MRRPTLIVLVLIAAACGRTIVDVTKPSARVTFSSSSDSPASLNVSVAETPEQRQQGLSGVKNLPADFGMAFTYAAPTVDEFWMKDTLIPLSVAFVRADGTIVAIREMVPCTADPCRTYASPEPYTMAIETGPDWLRANHIVVGASASLEQVPTT